MKTLSTFLLIFTLTVSIAGPGDGKKDKVDDLARDIKASAWRMKIPSADEVRYV